MTTATAVQWRKEVRELLPWWCATVVTMAVCWALMRPDAMPADWLFKWALGFDRDWLLFFGLCAYGGGAVTLGALSIGQEYSHQTLTQLIAQPVARGRVLQVKLVVLAAMLASLGALAIGAWGTEPGWASITSDFGKSLIVALPIACGLLLAPWLTMVGRGPLAGAIFTLVLPSFLWLVGDYFRLSPSLCLAAIGALAAVGATMTWRTFLNLEAVDAHQLDVDMSAWFRRASVHSQPGRTHNRVVLIIKKELRLQQPTFVVSGLYVAVCLAVMTIRRFVPDAFHGSYPLFVATALNSGLISLMSGAIASAEERRLSTAEWHILLPFAAWRQWLLKVCVAVALPFALAVVPAMLLDAMAAESGLRDGLKPAIVVMLSLSALYVSSVSTNGIRALLTAIPVIALAVFSSLGLFWPISRAAQPAIDWLVRTLPIVEIDGHAFAWWVRYGTPMMTMGFGLLLIWFGYTNHRTSDRNMSRVARQFLWLSAYAIAAMILLRLIVQLILKWATVTPR